MNSTTKYPSIGRCDDAGRVDQWLSFCEASFVGHDFDFSVDAAASKNGDDRKSRTRKNTFVRSGLYAQLSNGDICRWDEQIRRDVGRTFPELKLFSSVDGIGQRQMFDVLHAFAQYAPDIGYCQGMNFIAGFLLVQVHEDRQKDSTNWLCDLTVEEAVFWLLVGLMRAPKYSMDGLFSEGLPRLFSTTYQVQKAIDRIAPSVRKHLDRYDVQMTSFLPQWLFAIFTTHMDLNSDEILVVWDALFRDGWNAVVRIAIGLLVGSKSVILSKTNHDDCVKYLCDDLFKRKDLMQMIRAGSAAREAISDARLDSYAQEMLGLDDVRSYDNSGAGESGWVAQKDAWLAWSRSVTSRFTDVASMSLQQILPGSVLHAVGSSAQIKHRFSSSVKISIGSAAMTIRAVQSALSKSARSKLDRALAELAPLRRTAGTVLSTSTKRASEDDDDRVDPRGPLVEVHFRKESVHVPISAVGGDRSERDNGNALDLCRLRQLILLSFPSLCDETTGGSADAASKSVRDREDDDLDCESSSHAAAAAAAVPTFEVRCRIRDKVDGLPKWIVARDDRDVARAIEAGLSVAERSVAAVSETKMQSSKIASSSSNEEDPDADDLVVVSSARCIAVFEVVTAEDAARQAEKLAHIAKHESRLYRGQLASLRRKVDAAYAMIRDPAAAFWPKILAVSALVYVVSPFDAIPDAIPVVGLADDFAVLTALFASFSSMSVDLKKYEANAGAEVEPPVCEENAASGRVRTEALRKIEGTTDTSVELTTRRTESRRGTTKHTPDGEYVDEIDSDFDIEDFHDIEDDYVEIKEGAE